MLNATSSSLRVATARVSHEPSALRTLVAVLTACAIGTSPGIAGAAATSSVSKTELGPVGEEVEEVEVPPGAEVEPEGPDAETASGAVEAPPTDEAAGADDPTGLEATAVSEDDAIGDAEREDEAFEDEAFEDEASDDEAFDDEGDSGAPYDPRIDSPEAIEARRYVRGGIVLTSLGFALVVGSIALVASDPCTRAAGNSCQAAARNRGALTMGIPGSLVTVGGLVLLSVGIMQRRRIRATFTANREGGGLLVFGRF